MLEMKEVLVGPCGLRCDICTMYRAYHDRNLDLLKEAPKNFCRRLGISEETGLEDLACNGCRSSVLFEYCAECPLRECVSKKGVNWCYECIDFPCERLVNWQANWRMPVITNLMEIKMIGADEWLKQQEKRWICPRCGTKLHWFSFGLCPDCGEEMPET